MKPLTTLFEDNFLRISMADGFGDPDLVTLSISSSPRIGEKVAKEEFFGTITATSGKAIFIIDKTSSFGNRLDWDLIQTMLTPHLEGKTIRAVGFCLGGFLAVVLSKYFKIDAVIAITPQYGVSPDYFIRNENDPNPDRFNWFTDLYTDKIDVFHIPDLNGYFQDRTRYYVLHGCFDFDLMQMKYFPVQDNIVVFDFGEDYSHGLPGDLGLDLPTIINACAEHKPEVVFDYIKKHYEDKK
tara:strand:- start:286 stop:1005 length:720 start_codon:yes stop_codon:yes gene_type:complete